jgi:CRP/FNR family transcriptional regulator, cyclic AMP receptor protein
MENIRRAVLDIIDDVAVFHYLDKGEVEELVPYLEYRKYQEGEVLFEEGEPGEFICFISSGKMEIKKETDFKGKQVILALLSKGSFVGELSIIDGKPRSATVVSLEPSETLILHGDKFEELVNEHPRIGVKILRGIARILSLRLRKSGDRLAAIF